MAKIGARELRAALAALTKSADEFSRDGTRGAQLGFAAGALPEAYDQITDDDPNVDAGSVLGQGAKGFLLGAGAGAGVGMGIRGSVNAARLAGRGINSLRSALAERAGPSARMGIDDAVGMEAGGMARGAYRAPNSLTEDAYEQMDGGNRADIEDIISRIAPNLSPMQQRMLPQVRGIDDIVEMLRRMGYGDDDIASMMGVNR